MKLACDRASSRPKPCASLENSQRILSVRRSLFALVGRKQTMVRDHIYPKKSLVRAFGSRAQVLSTPQARQRSSCPRPQPNLVLNRPVECAAIRLRVLRCPTKLSAILSPSSRVPPSSGGHKIGAREEAHRVNTIRNQPKRRRVLIDELNHVDSQLLASFDGVSSHTPNGKTLRHSCPLTRFRRERKRVASKQVLTIHTYYITPQGAECPLVYAVCWDAQFPWMLHYAG